MIIYKSAEELSKMRTSGRILPGVLDRVLAAVAPGRTAGGLDPVAGEADAGRAAT